MKNLATLATIVVLANAEPSQKPPIHETTVPLAIAIVEYSGTPDAPRVYFLGGDYGFLANCAEGKAPEFYVYDKPAHRIAYLTDFAAFLTEIKKIPDGTSIDRVERCAPPFWQALPISQRHEIADMLKRKGCRLTGPADGNFTICVCKGDRAEGTMTLRLLKRAR